MRDWRLGLAFAGKFLALYGMLYIILQSEDNALLMGSILIFVVLMLIMTVTRNLDWYKVGEQIENITTTL
jgi:inner membrane protein